VTETKINTVLITYAIRKRQKNISVTIKIGILTLLGQIFLAIGRIKEVSVNLLHKNPRRDLAVTVRESLTVYLFVLSSIFQFIKM